jgi:hypothetical protein
MQPDTSTQNAPSALTTTRPEIMPYGTLANVSVVITSFVGMQTG